MAENGDMEVGGNLGFNLDGSLAFDYAVIPEPEVEVEVEAPAEVNFKPGGLVISFGKGVTREEELEEGQDDKCKLDVDLAVGALEERIAGDIELEANVDVEAQVEVEADAEGEVDAEVVVDAE